MGSQLLICVPVQNRGIALIIVLNLSDSGIQTGLTVAGFCSSICRHMPRHAKHLFAKFMFQHTRMRAGSLTISWDACQRLLALEYNSKILLT